jgi:O-antigen ligase
MTNRRKSPFSALPVAIGSRDLVVALCGLVMLLAPLLYGAVHVWAYVSLGLTLAALSIILLMGLVLGWGFPAILPAALPRPPLWGLVLAAGLLVLLQLAPLPQGLVGWLSPRAVEIRSLGNGYGLAPLIPLSLNSNATVQEILLAWPAVLLFFLVVFTVNSRRQIAALVFLLLVVALFEALYGLWHFQSHLIWGWKNPAYLGRLGGTFINSNHAAGYLGMAVLLGFGLFLAMDPGDGVRRGGPPEKSRLRFWTRAEHLEPLVRRSFFFLPLLVLLVAFFFAASRGAILALGIGLALMAGLWASRQSARWPLYLIAGFLAGVALYSLCIGGTAVFARIMNLNDVGRSEAFWGSWRLFREFPLVGAGLGAFDDLSYGIVPVNLSLTRLAYAHNDWLQVLAETGVPGFAIVAGGWLLFYGHLIRQWRRRRDHWVRGLGLGGLAALAAGAFHALGEFPFHIPGFSLTYAAIAALTFLTVHQHQNGKPFDYATWRPAGHRLAPWLGVALILVQAAYMGQAWQFWQAERAAPVANDSTRIPRILQAADYTRALAHNPRNAKYFAGLARALAGVGVENLEQARKVEVLLQQAIFLAPARWRSHFQLGDFLLGHYELAPRNFLPRGLRELDAAVTLFPERADLHLQLGLALTWTKMFYPAYVPPPLAKRAPEHLDRAVALDPELKNQVKPKGATR